MNTVAVVKVPLNANMMASSSSKTSYGQIVRSPARKKRLYAYKSLRCWMRFAPTGVVLKRPLRGVAIPGIALPAFLRNLIHSVVNAFVAVAEKGFVVANFIIARPNRPVARCGDKVPAIAAGAFEGDVHQFGFLEPSGGGMHGGDDFRTRVGQLHQEHHDARALARHLRGHFVIARGRRLKRQGVILLAPDRAAIV